MEKQESAASIPPLQGEGGERKRAGWGYLALRHQTPPRRFAPTLPLQGRDEKEQGSEK
jgi:hypothetical protein